jgi:hypothetical protein
MPHPVDRVIEQPLVARQYARSRRLPDGERDRYRIFARCGRRESDRPRAGLQIIYFIVASQARGRRAAPRNICDGRSHQ